MTRIIGGAAGSLRLATPGSETRPTSDRVREAWFSRLDANRSLRGVLVLDLFAGSGALGLEAASRGAGHITLVDNHSGANRALATNIQALTKALPHNPVFEVAKTTVSQFLARGVNRAYDLVFIDPPYEHETARVDEILGALLPHLAADAWVMVERSTRSTPITWPEGMRELPIKKYGETVLYFAEKS